MRKCNKCRVLKPETLDFFHKDGRGGLCKICKLCRNKYRQAKRNEFVKLRDTDDSGLRTVTIFNSETSKKCEVTFDPKENISVPNGVCLKPLFVVDKSQREAPLRLGFGGSFNPEDLRNVYNITEEIKGDKPKGPIGVGGRVKAIKMMAHDDGKRGITILNKVVNFFKGLWGKK